MSALEALGKIRAMVESRGPDTPNKHWGRKQYDDLIEYCDTIQAVLDGDEDAVLDEEDDVEEVTLLELLQECATAEIESMDDTDELLNAWLTADDLASRLRSRLIELKYWWES